MYQGILLTKQIISLMVPSGKACKLHPLVSFTTNQSNTILPAQVLVRTGGVGEDRRQGLELELGLG